jgi:hypothetical protein
LNALDFLLCDHLLTERDVLMCKRVHVTLPAQQLVTDRYRSCRNIAFLMPRLQVFSKVWTHDGSIDQQPWTR